MEKPKSELQTESNRFFADKIEVLPVSKEEFVQMVKSRYPSESEEEILQMKGINFDLEDKTIILMRTDVFPEQYMPYMETHEKWEAYIARKDGFNLFKKSIREYQKDKNVQDFNQETYQQYLNDVSVYNYDFRHEYAVFKEYQQALGDGKLDEYHEWIMNLRKEEKENTPSKKLKLIENDTNIRQSIYRKLKEHTKHSFTRK